MFDGVTLGLDQMRLAQQTDDAMRRGERDRVQPVGVEFEREG